MHYALHARLSRLHADGMAVNAVRIVCRTNDNVRDPCRKEEKAIANLAPKI